MALGRRGERPHVPARIDLGIQRAVRRTEHRVRQDRGDLARLVTVQELHRDAIRDACVDEFAHDHGLRLGLEVDQAAPGPQAEVRTEFLRQVLQLVPGGHREVQFRPASSRVEPDVAEVAPGRSRGEPIGLEQDDVRAPPGQVVGGRRPDDPAADDQHIR